MARDLFIPTGTGAIKKNERRKCRRRYGEIGALGHCRWGQEMVRPLQESPVVPSGEKLGWLDGPALSHTGSWTGPVSLVIRGHSVL